MVSFTTRDGTLVEFDTPKKDKEMAKKRRKLKKLKGPTEEFASLSPGTKYAALRPLRGKGFGLSAMDSPKVTFKKGTTRKSGMEARKKIAKLLVKKMKQDPELTMAVLKEARKA